MNCLTNCQTPSQTLPSHCTMATITANGLTWSQYSWTCSRFPMRKTALGSTPPQCILEFIPVPLMFRRGWGLLLPHMTPDDWSPTTAAIFSDHLRAIRDSKLSDAERAFLVIQPHDLYQISSCFSLNTSNWAFRDFGAVVWPQALSWDIGSVAAYEDGSVCAATFIHRYIGEFFSTASMVLWILVHTFTTHSLSSLTD